MENLRYEISSLQKEVLSMHSNERRRQDRTPTVNRTPRTSSRTSHATSSGKTLCFYFIDI